MTALEEIKEKAIELVLKIKGSEKSLPSFGYSRDYGTPYIEVDDSGMHYLAAERGMVISRKTTADLDELLYWIFSDVTFDMAVNFELQNRMADKDCRRMIFEKQEELLGVLNRIWQQNEGAEHERILVENPFDDLASLRANYFGELREQGFPEDEITQMAYEKYPGPEAGTN